MIDVRRLRVLRELHVRGTVRAAAEALDYTPSAISQQLAALEREVGARLLERVGRNVRLTEAALVLVRHADDLLEGLEEAQAEVAAVAAGRVTGVVRVAAFQSALLRIVAPAIAALATSQPGVRVEAVEAEVEEAVPQLDLRHLDILVGDEYAGQPRPRHPELRRETVLREGINLVLPEDHEVSADRPLGPRLADLAWAVCDAGTGHHDMHVRACRQVGGFEPDMRYRSNDFAVQLEMVRVTGAGALLPDLVVDYDAAGVRVLPLDRSDAGRDVFLLTRRSRTPAIDAVAVAIRETAAGLAT
jgi:DNA-binding transcriptional LysR family regulator